MSFLKVQVTLTLQMNEGNISPDMYPNMPGEIRALAIWDRAHYF